ncbi:hypothetical protein KAU08_03950 [bacterium]|nr:hypothetical protein [bacterium]
MRLFLAIFLISAMFLTPVLTSCVPSGYEEGSDNPNRPSEIQVDIDELPPGDDVQDVPEEGD